MALKCAKNDFKHSMVHRDRRNENIFGCFLVRFWGPAFLKNKQRAIQTFWLYIDRVFHQWL